MPLTPDERAWIQMLSARVDDLQNKLQDAQRNVQELQGRVMYLEVASRVPQQPQPPYQGPMGPGPRYGAKEEKE